MKGNRISYNKTRGRRGLIFTLAVIMTLSVCFTAPNAAATETPGTTGQSDNKASELRDNLANVNSELKEAKSEYDAAVSEMKSLEGKIAVLTEQIQTTEGEIEATQAQIAEYDKQIFELTEQIVALEREIYDQNSALNKRLRIMYETGEQSMLAVLLDSENFLDFLSNMEMVRLIHESDKAFLEELQIKYSELEAKKAELVRIDEELKAQKETLQAQKDQLESSKTELAGAKKRQQELRDAALEDIERLEKESKRISSELANLTSKWGDYAGGAMAWPVIGTVTSEFGMRNNPVTKRYVLHAGIDVGVPTGTPVHAAADGIVYSAGWNSGGYGNLVMLDNGSGIFTLYAHNSSFAVSAGQVVSRGDIIAYAGSTGNSTGPHCHFEVRVGGEPQNPRGWLG